MAGSTNEMRMEGSLLAKSAPYLRETNITSPTSPYVYNAASTDCVGLREPPNSRCLSSVCVARGGLAGEQEGLRITSEERIQGTPLFRPPAAGTAVLRSAGVGAGSWESTERRAQSAADRERKKSRSD